MSSVRSDARQATHHTRRRHASVCCYISSSSPFRAAKKSSRDEMYRAILVGFFLLQTVLSYLIPIIGPALSFIHLSWLYALYCFEYKWSLGGWTLEKKLMHLEQNWFGFLTNRIVSVLWLTYAFIGRILQALGALSHWRPFLFRIS